MENVSAIALAPPFKYYEPRAQSRGSLGIIYCWALMAARGSARLTLDRRRDLIRDRPYCATAAEAPLDESQERYHFAHTNTAKQHSALALPCTFLLMT